MPNSFFQFKQFRIDQLESGMKVTTDACLFGAWVAKDISNFSPSSILDIGTGTGLLSLMLAQKNKKSQFTALEINKAAFEQAQENFNNSPWTERFTLLHQSLQEFNSVNTFDVIICNPPFFTNNLKGPSNNKNQALHADTLSIEECVKGIINNLKNAGKVFVLYPEFEMDQFIAEASKVNLFPEEIVLVKNAENKPVFRKMVKFQFGPSESAEKTLFIRGRENLYTRSLEELIEDYYL
jgi:tRNA1Val (adenine37-N6)-methyltransferase